MTDTQVAAGTPADPMPVSFNVATRVAQYLQLRAKRKAMAEAYDQQDKPYAEMENLLSGLILQHLEAVGADNIKTPAGTCYRSEKSTASLEDPDLFMKHVKETEQFDLLDRKANVTAVKAYIAEHGGALPPGVKISTRLTLGVRSPVKKPPGVT